jgi:hypothetical protein
MQVLKTKWFARFARQERITDARLREAVARAERGLIDADLGGGLIKQRVATPGAGRSSGYRTVIAYHTRNRAVFFLCFAKSEQENIDSNQLTTAREFAAKWLAATNDRIA